MLLKYPQILYFLFLLIIPIIVHLFQLRKFQKEYFTNLKFLRELDIKTRKSSQLKKWLLLVTRLLLLSFIIIAFAQPFFKAKDAKGKNNELFVILDNSYSMQAKGKQGELLKRNIQELLEHIPEDKIFTFLTADDAFYDTDIRSIQNKLQNLDYSSSGFSLENEIAKVKSLKPNKGKDIVVITDAKSLKPQDIEALNNEHNIVFSVPKSENTYNVSIDSVYIHQVLDDFYELKIKVSEYGQNTNQIPVALFNQKELVAKTLLSENQNELIFTIPKKDFNGYVEIEDNSLTYDNHYYFSISKPIKTKVLAIGHADKNEFLSRIYTSDYFELTDSELKDLDYNLVEQQHVVVVNEPEDIPQSLMVTLKAFGDNGGTLIFIPSEKSNINSLTQLISQFSTVIFEPISHHKKLVTKIAFDNPVFKNVFEKKIQNFQYPHVNSSYAIKSSGLPVLSYEDGSAFLSEIKKQENSVYLFTAPISTSNSNFLNSPLVVLAFYNMAQNQEHTGVMSRFITDESPVFIEAKLSKNEVVKLKNNTDEFIPAQQIFSQKIKLSFNEVPKKSGNYGVYKNEELLANIGFNYYRTEGDLSINNIGLLKDYPQKSISNIFSDLESERSDNLLWKLFLLLGFVFLVLELLIQKFIK